MQRSLVRRRYQRGSLFLREQKYSKVWVFRHREDVMEEGQIRRRISRSVVIGTKTKDLTGQLPWYPTERLAWRSPEIKRLLDQVNNFTYQGRRCSTFEPFAVRWLATVATQHKPSTQVTTQSHVQKRILPYFGEYPLHEIGPECIQAFIAEMNLSPKSVRNIVGTLRLMLKSARAWGYIERNPVLDVILPKRKQATRSVLTVEQMQQIIRHAEEPYRSLYWIAAETGMRIGELLGLRVKDIDFDRGLTFVRQSVWQGKLQEPKTENAIRTFALSPALGSQLQEYLRCQWQDNPNGLLFASTKGVPVDYNSLLSRHLYPTLDQLGIPRCGFHAFRHGNATMMDRIGVPMKVRQQRLGHSDPNITLGVYTHVASEDDRNCAERLGQLLALDTQTPAPVQ